MNLKPIHPFPARMAPELALQGLRNLKRNSVVLDSMSGSGTVLRVAAESGHRAIGFDVDPLAVLMSKVWTTPVADAKIELAASGMISAAKSLKEYNLPWIDSSKETQDYIQFWFEKKQADQLQRLSSILYGMDGKMANVLRIALSKTIITKENGASVARDTSHSRPHRVFFNNEYDVYDGFLRSARMLSKRINTGALLGKVRVNRGDSRNISRIEAHSVDAVITSPPYLNAIDYLRGHRLSLVWLGYGVEDIRTVRSESIGTERAMGKQRDALLVNTLLRCAGDLQKLRTNELGMVERYATDVYQFMKQLRRLIKHDGQILLVLGDSCLRGVDVSNANINVSAGHLAELTLVNEYQRPLPVNRRYLPMPAADPNASLSKRMRHETILRFKPR